MGESAVRTTGPWSSEAVAAFLDESVVPIRLAAVAPSGWPVILSLWFVRDGDSLVCATQRSASIVATLAAEGRCAFEVSVNDPPYRGVRGRATVSLEPDTDLSILRRLVERYLGSADGTFARWLLGRDTPEVAIRLSPTEIASWDFRQRMTS
jgi:hypothetical protein